MIRYKLIYLWYRLKRNSPSTSRGKVARFITRNIEEPTRITLAKIRGEYDEGDIE